MNNLLFTNSSAFVLGSEYKHTQQCQSRPSFMDLLLKHHNPMSISTSKFVPISFLCSSLCAFFSTMYSLTHIDRKYFTPLQLIFPIIPFISSLNKLRRQARGPVQAVKALLPAQNNGSGLQCRSIHFFDLVCVRLTCRRLRSNAQLFQLSNPRFIYSYPLL